MAGKSKRALVPQAAPETPVVSTAEAEAVPALLSMDPQQYVDTAFGPVDQDLALAVTEVGLVVHDLSTTTGLDAAKASRQVFRELRWAVDKLHKEYKAPVLQIGRLIDGRYNQIKDAIAPYEAHYNDAITAEEQRQADMARARENAELERLATIERRIAALAKMPVEALGQSSNMIESILKDVEAEIIDDSYAESQDIAQAAKDKAIGELQRALQQAITAEADSAELARLRSQGALSAPEYEPDYALDPDHGIPIGEVLLDCYLYLIGQAHDYDTLLTNVIATLQALHYDLPPNELPGAAHAEPETF